jgi:hypothetical protein
VALAPRAQNHISGDVVVFPHGDSYFIGLGRALPAAPGLTDELVGLAARDWTLPTLT